MSMSITTRGSTRLELIGRCLQYRKEDRIDVIAMANDEYLRPTTKGRGCPANADKLLWVLTQVKHTRHRTTVTTISDITDGCGDNDYHNKTISDSSDEKWFTFAKCWATKSIEENTFSNYYHYYNWINGRKDTQTLLSSPPQLFSDRTLGQRVRTPLTPDSRHHYFRPDSPFCPLRRPLLSITNWITRQSISYWALDLKTFRNRSLKTNENSSLKNQTNESKITRKLIIYYAIDWTPKTLHSHLSHLSLKALSLCLQSIDNNLLAINYVINYSN